MNMLVFLYFFLFAKGVLCQQNTQNTENSNGGFPSNANMASLQANQSRFFPGSLGFFPPPFPGMRPPMPFPQGQANASFGFQGNWTSNGGSGQLAPGMVPPFFMMPLPNTQANASFGFQGSNGGNRPLSPGMTPPFFMMPPSALTNAQANASFGFQGNWTSNGGSRPLPPGMTPPFFMMPPMALPPGGNRPGMGAFPLGVRPNGNVQGTGAFPPVMPTFPLGTSALVQGSATFPLGTLPQNLSTSLQVTEPIPQPSTAVTQPPSTNASSEQLLLPPLFRPVAAA